MAVLVSELDEVVAVPVSELDEVVAVLGTGLAQTPPDAVDTPFA